MPSSDLDDASSSPASPASVKGRPPPLPGSPPHISEASQPSRAEQKWVSWMVPAIVVANVAMMVVSLYVNNCPAQPNLQGACFCHFLGRFSFQPLSQNPVFGPSPSTLDKLGALKWEGVVDQHQWWRLITSMWLHAGLLHLLANMMSLGFMGIRLEQQFGFLRIGVIYLFSGFGGSIISLLFIRNSLSVGASGALFGLLGAILSEFITNWTIYSNKVATLSSMLLIIMINMAIGILPHVDNFAHIGGFLTGFFLGFVLLLQPQFAWLERYSLPVSSRAKSKYMVYQYVFAVVAFTLLVVGFVVSLVKLFRGEDGNDGCHWCHYLSCVPTSKWSCQN